MSASLPHDPREAQDGPEVSGAGAARSEQARLAAYDVLRVRAANPGLLTLSGTNTWVVGRSPAWVVDPGPLLDEHLNTIAAAVDARGGLGGVVLTHDHSDHSEAVAAVRERFAAPLAAARGAPDVLLLDGLRVGPFEAIATPGHASDHFALIAGAACFTGDAVLGEGSVFVSPHPGAMAGYMRALQRLRDREDIDVLCPGHGPPVWEPRAKLEEYIEHRSERERKLLATLAEGRRTIPEMLAGAWPEVPAFMHPAATATLAAHLDKLEEEGRLPEGVERPEYESTQL